MINKNIRRKFIINLNYIHKMYLLYVRNNTNNY